MFPVLSFINHEHITNNSEFVWFVLGLHSCESAAIKSIFLLQKKKTYSGRAVAALPFEPIPAVRRITHRDVPGDHPRETGLAFIYMLCSMTLRVFIGRVSGHDLPPVVARRLSK